MLLAGPGHGGARDMIAGKLNIFQRLVRQWDALHPYNALQILHLDGQADLNALRRAWDQTMYATGLGRVRLNGRRFWSECLNGEMVRYTVRDLPPGASLEDCISDELNRPFSEEEGVPFRPFVLQQDGAYFAGVTYHHWFADSVSIRSLLKQWFLRLFDPGQIRRDGSIGSPPGGYWDLFGSTTGQWRLAEGMLSSLRWTSRFKRVRRIDSKRFADLNVRFRIERLPDGWVDRLLSWARAHQITLNDLLLAAIAEACDKHLPFHHSPRRPDLGLGTIHDLRPHARQDLSDTFGLFLGFTSVICEPDDLCGFARLARTIHQQNVANKSSGSPQASLIRMAVGWAVGGLYSRRRLLDFYRKRVPMSAGISNVNLNRTWAAQYHPSPLLDYLRVSPTGPMLPLVFTPSTLGKTFHFGLTYRPAILDEERMPALVQTFRQRLDQLVQSV